MKCGKQMPDGVAFCMNCGEKMADLSAAPQPVPKPVPDRDRIAKRRGILSFAFTVLSALCFLIALIADSGNLLFVSIYSGFLGLLFSATGSMLNSVLRTAIIGLSLYQVFDFVSEFGYRKTSFLLSRMLPVLILIVILSVILFLRRKKASEYRRTTLGKIGFAGSICCILAFVIMYLRWVSIGAAPMF